MNSMTHGPSTPPKAQYPGKRGGRPTNRPDPDTLAELYRTHTARQIARMYGVKRGTVAHWVWMDKKGDSQK